MKAILTGNEAVARGAYEAGIIYASAYPGTPSTEILENIAQNDEIIAEWAPNEKVALETTIGASVAGARTLAAMKHVGVNVAADPLMTFAYTGVNGGMVLVSADDPGMHSSQNEQDNRYYAKFAKVAMLEPSNSQEAKDMVKKGIQISEKYDTPVLLRMTTRICHSKSLVEFGEKEEKNIKKPYVKDIQKYVAVPAISRKLRIALDKRVKNLETFSDETDLNFIEWNGKEVGVISSGIAYEYAKEVFGSEASYLKLGFTFPLPMEKIKAFAGQVGKLYIIEELEPYIEEQVKAAGIECIGKEKVPGISELNPDILAKTLLDTKTELIDYDKSEIADRPPVLCAGCPHRGFFAELSKRKNIMITGDIGCYTLGVMSPLNAIDSVVCMGASISTGHGAQKIFDQFKEDKRVFSVIGDSTFFHTGINSLLNVVYNKSNNITCILDNRITGMTGHQENPGTGFTLQGASTKIIEIEPLVKALGIEHVRTINPLNLGEVKQTIDWAIKIKEPVVIITRWPCVLKKLSRQDKEEFGNYFSTCSVNEEKCTGCKLCIKTGCPALQFDRTNRKVRIDSIQCVGCGVCEQICTFKAIEKVGEKQ